MRWQVEANGDSDEVVFFFREMFFLFNTEHWISLICDRKQGLSFGIVGRVAMVLI